MENLLTDKPWMCPVTITLIKGNIWASQEYFGTLPCTDPESFVRGGPTLTKVFLGLFRSKYHSRRDIIDPQAKCHLIVNGVSLAFWWWPNTECWLGSFVIFMGSGQVLLKTQYFCDFFFLGGGGGRGRGRGDLLPPSGSTQESTHNRSTKIYFEVLTGLLYQSYLIGKQWRLRR